MILSFFTMYKETYILTLPCAYSTNNLHLASAKCNIDSIILPGNQVVHAANCKKQQYPPVKVRNCVNIDCHQSRECSKCHKMNTTFVTKAITKINPMAKGWPGYSKNFVERNLIAEALLFFPTRSRRCLKQLVQMLLLPKKMLDAIVKSYGCGPRLTKLEGTCTAF
jgi:hypothetical protein